MLSSGVNNQKLFSNADFSENASNLNSGTNPSTASTTPNQSQGSQFSPLQHLPRRPPDSSIFQTPDGATSPCNNAGLGMASERGQATNYEKIESLLESNHGEPSAKTSSLSNIPFNQKRQFKISTEDKTHLDKIASECPRNELEPSVPYAKRLYERYPSLNFSQMKYLADISQTAFLYSVKKPEKEMKLSPQAEEIVKENSKREGVSKQQYALELTNLGMNKKDACIAANIKATTYNIFSRIKSTLNEKERKLLERCPDNKYKNLKERVVALYNEDHKITPDNLSKITGHSITVVRKYLNEAKSSQLHAKSKVRIPFEWDNMYETIRELLNNNKNMSTEEVQDMTGRARSRVAPIVYALRYAETVRKFREQNPRVDGDKTSSDYAKRLLRDDRNKDISPVMLAAVCCIAEDSAIYLKRICSSQKSTDCVDPVVVKEEPVLWPFTGNDVVANAVDMTHTQYYGIEGLTTVIDEEGTRLEFRGSPDFVMEHPMEYDPKKDDAFPLRNPADSSQVHPDFADPADPTKVSSNVRINNIEFGRGMKPVLKYWLKPSLTMVQGGQGEKKAHETKILNHLKEDVWSELKRLIEGRQQSEPRCKARRLTQEDLGPNEKTLLNQYGVFPMDPENVDEKKLPVLENGKILGVYAGAFTPVNSASAYEITNPEAPRSLAYQLDLPGKRREDYIVGAYGWANTVAFANTAITTQTMTRGDVKASIDHSRINACFINLDMNFVSVNGDTKVLPIGVMIGTKNKMYDFQDGKLKAREIRVDYGDNYVEVQFSKQASTVQEGQSNRKKIELKQEPMETD